MNLELVVMPLVGAAIGYSTNWVAIRMLFHPRRAWSLFGWHIPLTPGVVPRYRAKLEEKIAESVTQLMTADNIKQHLQNADTQHRLRCYFDEELRDNILTRFMPEMIKDIVFQYVLDRITNSLDRIATSQDVRELAYKGTRKMPDSVVEARIKDIASSSLRSITNTGAVLGFLVGLAQYILLQLMGG